MTENNIELFKPGYIQTPIQRAATIQEKLEIRSDLQSLINWCMGAMKRLYAQAGRVSMTSLTLAYNLARQNGTTPAGMNLHSAHWQTNCGITMAQLSQLGHHNLKARMRCILII